MPQFYHASAASVYAYCLGDFPTRKECPFLVVVFVLSALKQLLGRVKRGKEMGVQKLLAQPSVEAFNEGILEGILSWLPGLNVLDVDSVLRSPGLKGLGAKYWPVVAVDCLRASLHSNCRIKKARHIGCWQDVPREQAQIAGITRWRFGEVAQFSY